MFMNEYEIEGAAERYSGHSVLGPATAFLRAYMQEVNAHSDGWPYWAPPVRAAAKLMRLIEAAGEGGLVVRSDVVKALSPIKAFMTRRGTAAGMTMPELRS